MDDGKGKQTPNSMSLMSEIFTGGSGKITVKTSIYFLW
jgi:hypothetical protein